MTNIKEKVIGDYVVDYFGLIFPPFSVAGCGVMIDGQVWEQALFLRQKVHYINHKENNLIPQHLSLV